MAITREKVTTDVERRVLLSLITSTRTMKRIRLVADPLLFQSSYARVVARWCLDHYDKYQRAPKLHIRDIYNAKLQRGKIHEDDAEILDLFMRKLVKLQKYYNTASVDFLVDEAGKFFKERQLLNMSAEIKELVSRNQLNEAEAKLTSFRTIDATRVEQAVNPFTNADAIYDAFESDTDPLVVFSGELGEMWNNFFVRESLVGFLGREKIGKSWLLEEIAFRGAKNKKNVLIVQVGDMSRKQVIRRFQIRVAGKSDKKRYCKEMQVPVLDCMHNQDNTCRRKVRSCDTGILDPDEKRPTLSEFKDMTKRAPPEYKPCSYCHTNKKRGFQASLWYTMREAVTPLTWKEGYRLSSKFFQRLGKHDFKLLTYPNQGASISDIDNKLEIWKETEGWLPDIIVIDYADNVKPEPGDSSKEFRHQQNGIWSAMSALRLKWHCLVATATQADSKAYDTALLKLSNFSEDKRKYAHVTAFFSLNQLEEEKNSGIMRIGLLLAREEAFSTADTVHVIQCPQIGRPCLDSFRL